MARRGGRIDAEPETACETADGTAGEVRTVTEWKWLRMTWQLAGRDESTTLQLTLSCPRNAASRASLRVDNEELAVGDEREAMRSHCRDALDRIGTSVAGGW